MSINLLIEGWRFIPHSYACVNMWQCLELLKLNNIKLYHNDIKYVNDGWKLNDVMFEKEFYEKICQISALKHIEEADVIYRIHTPFNLATLKDKPVFSFMTCEAGWLPTQCFTNTKKIIQSLPTTGITIITPSKWSKNGLIRCGADHNLIEQVPHGVNISIFKPIEPEEKNELKKIQAWENKFVFLHVGAMTPNKGIDLLLKAFAVVNDKYPDTLLCLKGTDSLYNSIQKLKNSNYLLNAEENERVADNLVYLGNDLSFANMAKLYQSVDAYVSPYRAEGFNLPVLEAAACGIPIICTSGGPTDDFVLDSFAMQIESLFQAENESILLEPNLDNLIHHMINVIEDSDFYENAHIFGPLHVFLNYSWDIVVDNLLQVICRKSGLNI